MQDYHAIVELEDVLKAVEKNSTGSRPKELFEDVLEEVEAAFQKERTLLKDAKLDLQPDTSFADFSAAIDAHEEGKLANMLESHRCFSPPIVHVAFTFSWTCHRN